MQKKTERLIKVSLLITIVFFSMTGNVFAASPIESTILKLDIKGKDLKGAHAINYADEYLKLVDDKTISAADRVYALKGCMAYLCRVWYNGYPEEVIPKGDEVFSRYSGDLVGASPEIEFGFVQSYVTSFLGEELITNKKPLSDCLAIIDANEKLFDLDPQEPRADLTRAALCKIANDKERAAEFVEKYISNTADPDGYAYTIMAWAYEGLGRFDEIMTIVKAKMQRYGSMPNVAASNAKILVSLLNSGNLDETEVLDILPIFAHDGKAMAIILTAIADQKLKAGDANTALAYGKLCYAVAPMNDITTTIKTVARYVAAKNSLPTEGAQFLEYQTYGAAGRDGQVGTEDDCKELLAGIPSPLPEDVVAAIDARLQQMTPRLDNTYPALGDRSPRADSVYALLRDRGCVCLTLGRPLEALSIFRSAWDAAPVEWVDEANGLVSRALKALDGDLLRANAYLHFQKFGSVGPDGEAGTADDLADPLMGEQLPPLPSEVREVLVQIAQNPKRDADTYQFGGFASLALGEYEKGFDKLRVAYVMVDSGPDQAVIIENIAAAIKSFDGNVQRANRYLIFQKHGIGGSDGQVGTEDDLENPLPEILRDIKKK